MKKKKLFKKLDLKKSVVSNFKSKSLKGGTRNCGSGPEDTGPLSNQSGCYPTIDGCDPWTGSAACPGQ